MPTSSPKKRIAIVFYETYLGCAPSLINAARLLDENEWHVDILMRQSQDEFAEPPWLGEHVQIMLVNPDRELSSQANTSEAKQVSWKSRVRAVLPGVLSRRLASLRDTKDRMLASIRPANWNACPRFVDAVSSATQDRRYDAVIGVDTLGLAAAAPLASRLSVPLIYWSLEIMFLNQFWSPAKRRSKRIERRCHQLADVLVIQDTERQASLCRENRVPQCPTLLIPNSPRGHVAEDLVTGHFNRQFGLDLSTRVILHAGSICEGMRSSDLAASAATLPDDCRLIFHSHTPIDLQTHYYRDIVAAGAGKVLISTQPVPYDELDTLMASADIGIVIYDSSLGPNFQLLAGASGKLSHYLRCRVPVISVDNPSIARVLDENRCGIGVQRVEDINDAVHRILSDHESYQSRAQTTYETQFEFEKHFEQLLDFLDERTALTNLG